MSERERPIREWNAVTYLRDFIQTGLILSPREQAVWEYLQKNRKKQVFIFIQNLIGQIFQKNTELAKDVVK